MRRLAAAVVPALADYCAVDLQTQPGRRPPGRAAVPPRRPSSVRSSPRLGPRRAGYRRGLLWPRRRCGTGEPVHLPTSGTPTTSRGRRATTQLLAGGAQAAAPRARRGAAARPGARPGRADAGPGRDLGRAFDAEDLGLARTLAARAALAVDNALLFEAESSQRRRADALAAAGTALAASGLASDEAVAVLLEHVVPALAQSPSCTPTSGRHPRCARPPRRARPAARRGPTDETRPADRRGPLARCPASPTRLTRGPGAAAASATPQLATVDETLLAPCRSRRRDGLRALLGATGRRSADGPCHDLRHAHRGAPRRLGVHRRRGALPGRARAAGRPDARQRAALRERAARGPGAAAVAVAGQAAADRRARRGGPLPRRSRRTEVGGDWYDVIPLPGRRVAVAVGDVMGRGVHAAAVMGQLRAAAAQLRRGGPRARRGPRAPRGLHRGPRGRTPGHLPRRRARRRRRHGDVRVRGAPAAAVPGCGRPGRLRRGRPGLPLGWRRL